MRKLKGLRNLTLIFCLNWNKLIWIQAQKHAAHIKKSNTLLENIFINYPIPAPSSRTSFPLIFGSIPMTSGCSSCVKVSALLSNIISSTLWAMECLFQNSVIWSRVWLDSTSVATENNMAFQVNGYSLGSLKTSFFETLQKVFSCKKQFSQGTNLRLFP